MTWTVHEPHAEEYLDKITDTTLHKNTAPRLLLEFRAPFKKFLHD